MSKEEKNRNMEDYDEIDKLLQKKYNEIVVPKSMFNTDKVFARYKAERKKRTVRVLSAVLLFVVVLILLVCILSLSQNQTLKLQTF